MTHLAIATVLDPRFKYSAVAKVKDLMKTTAQNKVESDSSDNFEKPEDNFCLWEDHHKLVRKNWKKSKTDCTGSDKLSIYLRSPVGRLNENPLKTLNK